MLQEKPAPTEAGQPAEAEWPDGVFVKVAPYKDRVHVRFREHSDTLLMDLAQAREFAQALRQAANIAERLLRSRP